MKVGIDASALIKEKPTGVEVVTRDLIYALISSAPKHYFYLYTPQVPPGAFTRLANVTTRVIPASRLWTQRALPKAIHEDNLDIFWSPSNMLPPNLKMKTLATIHDLATVKFPRLYTLKERLLSRITIKRAAQSATKVLAISLQTKKDLTEYFKVPAGRIEVIYMALPTMSKPVKPKFKLPKRYLLVVGRIEPRKNPLNIVKAFAKVAKIDPTLHLIFAGSPGTGMSNVTTLIKKLRIQSRVKVLGFVPAANHSWLIQNAEIMLFPSLYEGFGLPILEGFHFETPVITSNYGAMSEIAGGGAMLVDPKNPGDIAKGIEAMLLDKKLVMRYIAAGRLRLKDFSWKLSALKLEKLIDSIK